MRKDKPLYDLEKLPDYAIIAELRKRNKAFKVEIGKQNAYIEELEQERDEAKALLAAYQGKDISELIEVDDTAKAILKKSTLWVEVQNQIRGLQNKLKKTKNEVYTLYYTNEQLRQKLHSNN